MFLYKKSKHFLSFIILTLFLFPSYSTAYFIGDYIWNNDLSIQTNSDFQNDQINTLNLESESYILIEKSTGQVLCSYNSHEKLRPASVTKIMSILLIMEALDNGTISLDTPIPCSENARLMGGSQIWLDETETLTVDEMLKAICVVSANDCTVAMAEFLCGNEEIFVNKMNEKAKSLGMNDTTFKNCHGIDEDGHFTSSYDIALMSRELLSKYPNIKNYTTIWTDSLRDGKSELVNTNKLIRTYNGITGLKTGSTSLALYNLSASATRNNLSLIAVVLRAPTPKIRFSEAKLLLDYGFANYEHIKLHDSNDYFGNTEISKGVEKSVNILFEKGVGYIKEKNENLEITEELNLLQNLEAPISKGQFLGTIDYYSNGNKLLSTNLVAEKDIKKIDFTSLFSKNISQYFTLLKK